MRTIWRRLRNDIRGTTAIEYGLIVATISLSLLLSAQFLADEIDAMWRLIGSSVSTL